MLGLSIATITLFMVGGCFHMFRPYEIKAPLTLEQARRNKYITQPLPETASNIWVFSDPVGPGTYEYRLRFDAPPSDCTEYAQMIVARNPRAAAGWAESPIEFVEGLSPTEDHLLERLPWFDVHLARTGVVFNYSWTQTTNGPSIYETIWVDQARGSLYYFSGD